MTYPIPESCLKTGVIASFLVLFYICLFDIPFPSKEAWRQWSQTLEVASAAYQQMTMIPVYLASVP